MRLIAPGLAPTAIAVRIPTTDAGAAGRGRVRHDPLVSTNSGAAPGDPGLVVVHTTARRATADAGIVPGARFGVRGSSPWSAADRQPGAAGGRSVTSLCAAWHRRHAADRGL